MNICECIQVQVNGKVRAKLHVSRDTTDAEVVSRAMDAVSDWIKGRNIRKVTVVPWKTVSILIEV